MSIILNVSRDEILSVLASVQNVTSKTGTLAILNNIHIETLNDSIQITATDLEIGIRKTIPSEIISPGKITIPSKKLFEILRESSSDEIHFEVQENNWIKITTGASDYNLAGMVSEEFPSFPVYDEDNLTSFPANDLKDIINKTIFSIASNKESNFTLTGILIEKLEDSTIRMVSSDGHRLSLMEKKIDKELNLFQISKNTLIPRNGSQEIKKFCEGKEEINLGFMEKLMVLADNQDILVIRLMNGEFPDFNNLLNIIDKDNSIEIERVLLLNSMRRMNLFTEEKYNVVKWEMGNNKLTLTSQSLDIGNAREELDIDYQGDPMTMGFNGKYFVETMQALSTDKLRVHINGLGKPCMVCSDDEPGFISIIMPMEL